MITLIYEYIAMCIMKFGKCYGLECGHHTPKEYTEIQFDEFTNIDDATKPWWDSLIQHYRNFIQPIPGLNLEACPKCNEMKRIIRMNVFVERINYDGSRIVT